MIIFALYETCHEDVKRVFRKIFNFKNTKKNKILLYAEIKGSDLILFNYLIIYK
jgi:hypothetical protein